MVTKSDLTRAFAQGFVAFKDGRRFYGNGVVCWIGFDSFNSNWFYFADDVIDMNPADFLKSVGAGNALDRVFNALNGGNGLAGLKDSDPDEYAFYEAALTECNQKGGSR